MNEAWLTRSDHVMWLGLLLQYMLKYSPPSICHYKALLKIQGKLKAAIVTMSGSLNKIFPVDKFRMGHWPISTSITTYPPFES